MTPKKPPRAAAKRRKPAPAKKSARGGAADDVLPPINAQRAFEVKEPLEPVAAPPPVVPSWLADDPDFRADWDSLPAAQQAFVMALPENTTTDAYLQAYPNCTSRKGAAVDGYYLARKPAVARCVAAIIEAHLEEIGVTKPAILREIASVAFVSMTDVAEWGPEGVRFKPSSEIGKAAAAAIQSIKSKTRTVRKKDGGEVTTTTMEVKLHPKLDALEKLGTYKELFKRRGEVDGLFAVIAVLREQPRAEVERLNALPDADLRNEIGRLVSGSTRAKG